MPQGGERVQDGGRLVNKGVVPAGSHGEPWRVLHDRLGLP